MLTAIQHLLDMILYTVILYINYQPNSVHQTDILGEPESHLQFYANYTRLLSIALDYN